MPPSFFKKVTSQEEINNRDIIEGFFLYNPELRDATSVGFAFGLAPNKSKWFLPSGIDYVQNLYHCFTINNYRRRVIRNFLKDNQLQLASENILRAHKKEVNAFFKAILRRHICTQIQHFLNLDTPNNQQSFNNTLQNYQNTIELIILQQTTPPPYIEVNVPPDGNCFYYSLTCGIIYSILAGKINERSSTAEKLKIYFFAQMEKLLYLSFDTNQTLEASCIQLLNAFNYGDSMFETKEGIIIQNINWMRLLSMANKALRAIMLEFTSSDTRLDAPYKTKITAELLEELLENIYKIKPDFIDKINKKNYFYFASWEKIWGGEPEKHALAERLDLFIAPYQPRHEDNASFLTGELAAGNPSNPLICIRWEGYHFYLGLPRSDNAQEAEAISEAIISQQRTRFLSADFLLKTLQKELEKIKKITSKLKERGYSEDYLVIAKTESLIANLMKKEARLLEITQNEAQEPKQSEVLSIRRECVEEINTVLSENTKINTHRIIGPCLRGFADIFVGLAYISTLSLSHQLIRAIPGWSKFTLFSLENTKSFNQLASAAKKIDSEPLSIKEELINSYKKRQLEYY